MRVAVLAGLLLLALTGCAPAAEQAEVAATARRFATALADNDRPRRARCSPTRRVAPWNTTVGRAAA